MQVQATSQAPTDLVAVDDGFIVVPLLQLTSSHVKQRWEPYRLHYNTDSLDLPTEIFGERGQQHAY